MALAEKGRRSGPERQASGLAAPRSARAPNAPAAIDRGGSLLDRLKPVRPSHGASAVQNIGSGLARELDQTCAEVTRPKRQPPASAQVPAVRQPAATAIAAASPTDKALQKLQAAAHAKVMQERAERLAVENALLSQKLAAQEGAVADLRARVKALEEQLSAAGDGPTKSTDNQQAELPKASDHLHQKLAAAVMENARLARTTAERERALADARTRIEYLEAALAAAELECSRLAGEASGAREKQTAETSRAITAEKLLAEERQRLLARIIEIDGARKRAAQADAAASAAYDRQCQLEDALCLQQHQFEELERSQTTLAQATKALLHRFRDRERALAAADQRIKVLAEQNASFEAARDRADSPRQRGQETPRSRLEEAADATLRDWAELTRLLGDFVEPKTATAPATRRARSAA
jgi:predicted nuclease with TOPRIM domain